MLFKRKIYKELENWKKSQKIKRKALVIKGLRQVGKTTIVKEFCEDNYESVVYINFMDNRSIRNAFKGDYIVDDMIRDISASIGSAKFIPHKTVIIFDELQECAEARYAIKPFMIDGRFDIIATGSLLGLRGYNSRLSANIPTGFEKIITMYPMDFEEFLWAKGVDTELIEYLRNCFLDLKEVSESVNEAMHKNFKDYLCVGGMPDAVKTFLLTHDMNQVRETQVDILEEYKDDFGKHLDKNENEVINKTSLIKIMQVYDSITSQLAKENKKFQYSMIKKNASAREYSKAITWLKEFGLCTMCNNLNIIDAPLSGNKIEDQFKLYVIDTGLFVAMLDREVISEILFGTLKQYKGAIYENIIADALSKKGKDLYYYSNGIELDFITMHDGRVTAIEVKATNGNAKALKTAIRNKDKYNIQNNYKLTSGNIGTSNGITTIPHYMSMFL